MVGAALNLLGAGKTRGKVAVEAAAASGLAGARMVGADGATWTQPKSILLRLVDLAGGGYTNTLLGADPLERAQVSQWLEYVERHCGSVAGVEKVSPALDIHFKASTYVALDRLSLADLLMYHAVYPVVAVAPADKMRKMLPCLCRWFDLVQHDELFKARASTDYIPPLVDVVKKTDSAPPLGWTTKAVASASSTSSSRTAATAAAAAPKAPATGAAKAPAAPTDKDAAKQAKADKKAAAKAKKAAAKAKNKGAKGGGKGSGAADDNAAPIDPAEEAFFYSIDLKVGRINKAWEHEASEHLWCESIDVGEEKERQIASGLREYYKTKDDMEGRMVVVVCNLKSRKLGGFPSNGMVLAVKKGDTCELVEAPPGSSPGDRLIAEGVLPAGKEPLKAAVPNKVAKKKLFEKFSPDLKTDGDCFVVWRGHKLGGARVPTNSFSQVS